METRAHPSRRLRPILLLNRMEQMAHHHPRRRHRHHHRRQLSLRRLHHKLLQPLRQQRRKPLQQLMLGIKHSSRSSPTQTTRFVSVCLRVCESLLLTVLVPLLTRAAACLTYL